MRKALVSKDASAPIAPPSTEKVSGLISQLSAAETALEKALGPGTDEVIDSRGQPHLLRQAQAALRQSENRFRALIERSSDVIALLAADGTVLYDSPAVTRVLGYAPAELVGQSVFKLFHPEDRTRAKRVFAQLQATPKESITAVFRYRHKNGAYRLIEGTATNLLDEAGVKAVLLNYRDITKRHEAETSLRASEERFRALFEQAAVGVAQTDAHTGRYLRVNQRFAEIAGYTCEEMTRLKFADITHAEDLALDLEIMEQLRSGRLREYAREKRYVRKDGTIIWISLTVSVIGTPGEMPGSFIAIVNDIGERKRAEAEIRRQAAFVHFNPNPVLELSADGEVSYFNGAAGEMANAFGKKSPSEILPPNTAAIVRDCLSTVKPLLRMETQTQQRTISWSFFPVEDGHVVHCYAVDITERKQMEEHLRQSQKMEAVGQLSAGVAHDFNNLLTVIQGHLGIVEAQPNISADVADSLQEIAHAAARATTLTRQLLTFSRKQAMQARDIDANEVLKDISKMLRRVLRENISLDVRYAPASAPIYADVGMVEQILVNLVVNARDAMPAGGKVNIEVAREEISPEIAKLSPNARPGEFVRLAVSDTGTGIAPEVSAKIFEPFFTTKEAGKGTGLGLANVYGIVQQHSGWIEVQTEVGRGTTFIVHLPQRAPSAPAPAAGALLVELPRGTETILLVEDDLLVRLAMEPLLKRQGYHVLTATDGMKALEIWRRHHADIRLLLTDMILPDEMDGHQLAERLGSEKPGLPVIYTSGYVTERAERRVLLREGVNFLAKPVDPTRLLNTMRARLDPSGSGDPAPLAAPEDTPAL